MAERSVSELPISYPYNGRRIQNRRRGIFPLPTYWVHAIPVIVFVGFFILWFFSQSVTLVLKDGKIMSVHFIEESIPVRNESYVSLAILASRAVSQTSDFVSPNQNLTNHYNATHSPVEKSFLTVRIIQSLTDFFHEQL